ncbi:MAG: stage II sporulation protein D [Firmicutes bacterium]|nr:stage II sporulation protein D [Bacillota bacterium]
MPRTNQHWDRRLLHGLLLAFLVLTLGAAISGWKTIHRLPTSPEEQMSVRLYLSETNRLVTLPLEAYVRGVVAAEMPADFPPAALQAQAIAARTYAIWRLQHPSHPLPYGAQLTDRPEEGQAYLTDEALRKHWGNSYDQWSSRIDQAVRATQGQILVYEGAPAYALYFSNGGGQTEQSDILFGKAYPYLRSVPSYDADQPGGHSTVDFTPQQLRQRLEDPTLPDDVRGILATSQVITRSPAGTVEQVRIGGRQYTGVQVRQRLGLSSADFTFGQAGERLRFYVIGHGHRVGLSQWGAKVMAEKGASCREILSHFYIGCTLAPLSSITFSKF